MIMLIVIASVLMASISIIQFKNEAKDYHQKRLDQKEFAIKEHINYVLSNTTYPLTERNLPLIFKDKIHELADIHNLEINIYSLNGKLLKSSKSSFSVDKVAPPIPNYVLKLVQSSVEKRYVDIKTVDGVKNRSSYSQIKDDKFKPLGILNVPYVEVDGFYETELQQFLLRLSQVYSFIGIYQRIDFFTIGFNDDFLVLLVQTRFGYFIRNGFQRFGNITRKEIRQSKGDNQHKRIHLT